jgi:hypothetical protein
VIYTLVIEYNLQRKWGDRVTSTSNMNTRGSNETEPPPQRVAFGFSAASLS